jgi:hypothetical protein
LRGKPGKILVRKKKLAGDRKRTYKKALKKEGRKKEESDDLRTAPHPEARK